MNSSQSATTNLPVGVVTFLFTDIEGSTSLVQSLGDAYTPLLEAHQRVLDDLIAAHKGVILGTEGDSYFAVFENAVEAAVTCLAIHRVLSEVSWPENAEIKVRIGLHTGNGVLGGSNYVGLDVHRASRIANAGHGGQTIMSEATAIEVDGKLPANATLHDLGKYRLKDLSEPEVIFQLSGQGPVPTFPPLRTLDVIPNNLPLQLTSFVGREKELAAGAELLANNRVLTLTGPGGTGKSRLSLQLAAEASIRFDDGVFFVPLSSVFEVDLVASAIITALGLRSSGSSKTPRDSLLTQIEGKNMLMILDNFEQVIEARDLVSEMVAAAPRSKFLITSRAPLRIAGEQEMPIPPLLVDVDDPEAAERSEAVRLFLDRAMSVRPDFAITDDNRADVISVVSRLDGLPLAIELVASRIRLLPIGTIASRLDASMLTAGSFDLPERQRTITGAIEWGHDLLTPDQRQLFRRLAVFSGGAHIAQIEAICANESGTNTLEILSDLVENSLIRSNDDGEPRFRMLFVIREYALERLRQSDEWNSIHTKHLEAYTLLVESLASGFLKADRRQVFDAVEMDHDNIRAALDWGTEEAPDMAVRLAFAMWRFWQARGYLDEGLRRLQEVLSKDLSPSLRVKGLEALGGVHWWKGDMPSCLAAYEDALTLARQIDAPLREQANAIYNMALAVGFALEDLHRSDELLDEAESIYEELGDINGLGDVFWGRGNIGSFGKDLADSRAHLERSADFYERAGNEFGRVWAMFEVGGVAVLLGDPQGAWPYVRDGLRLFADHHDVSGVVMFMMSAARIALEMGDVRRAHRLAGAFHGLRISSGTDLAMINFNLVEELDYDVMERRTDQLGQDYQEGKSMEYRAAVDYALDGPTDDES